jgi:hypothetical protein
MAVLTTFRHRFWDNSGNPLAGGLVYTYGAGSSTPLASYTDAGGLTPNTNPIILDAKGEANIWLNGQYKINVTDANGVQITGWPVDNIGASVTGATQLYVDNAIAGANAYTDSKTAAAIATAAADATAKANAAAASSASLVTGTRLAFQQSAAPIGWVKDTTAALNDTAMRIVTGAVVGGGAVPFSTAMGTTAVSGTTGSHALTIAEMPSHTHAQTQQTAGGGAGTGAGLGPGTSASAAGSISTQAQGGGGGHTHAATGLTTTMNIAYVDFIIAVKS